MVRRKLAQVLGFFDRRDRAVLTRNFGLADLSPFGRKPWKPPEHKDRGLAPDPIKRDRWNRNLTPPGQERR
jgi:hypothetical protein